MCTSSRQINPFTGLMSQSRDELSIDEANAIAEWIRQQITGEEHPELLSLIEYAADWFDYSVEKHLASQKEKAEIACEKILGQANHA